jgi:hypothetical protein
MKLYSVPRNSLVRVLAQPVEETEVKPGEQLVMDFSGDQPDIKVPVEAPAIAEGDYIHFGHIDGMYSFCRDVDYNVVHMAAWTEVEVVDCTYENMAILRTVIKRGGRGKDGTEPLKHVRTDEMSDEWVDNCILYEETYRATNPMIEFYQWELKYREENGISIKD